MKIIKEETVLKDSSLSQVKGEIFNGYTKALDGFAFDIAKTTSPNIIVFCVTNTFETSYPLGSRFYFEAFTATWFDNNGKKPSIKEFIDMMNSSFAENVKLLQIEIIKYSDYFASGDYQQEFDKDEILEELQIVIDEFFQ